MKTQYLFTIIAITVVAISAFFLIFPQKISPPPASPNKPTIQTSSPTPTLIPSLTRTVPDLVPPLDRAGERVTKKMFGTFITPQNSPVQPERFQGYHTGVDFETFPEEQNTGISVHAVCKGKLLLKEYASGYGGVAVQSCTLEGQPITVIYGHLKLSSINISVDSNLNPADVIGILGKAYSSETDGQRKHLHLGFHKGTQINIRGYVQSQPELSNWLDPCQYVCHN